MIKNKYVIYLFLVFLAVVIIPYFFGDKDVSQSLSYMVGFNNKVGMILLVLFSIPLFLFSLRHSVQTDCCLFNDNKWIEGDNKIVISVIGISAFALIIEGILLCGENFTGTGGEGSYIMHYIYSAQNGFELYKDIHYIYGPLTIYPVIWLNKIGLSINCSYFFVLTIYHLVGLYMLYDILLLFKVSKKERGVIFLIAAVIFYPLETGMNFCSLRFVMMPWAVTKFVKFSINHLTPLRLSLFNICAFLLIFLYSQEYGLCYLFIVLIYCLYDLFGNRSWNGLLYSFELFLILIVSYFILPNYFMSILQAGSGGGSYPFIPSLVLFLVVAVFMAYGIIIGGQIKHFKNNYSIIIIELAFILAFPSALGRCDPPHIFYNLFFAIILSYVFAKQVFNKTIVISFYLICLITFFPHHITAVFRGVVGDIVRNNIVTVERVLDKIGYSGQVLDKLDDLNLKYEILDVVDGTVTSIDCDNKSYLILQNKSIYVETFFGHKPIWIGNKQGFDKELAELKAKKPDFLLLPKDYETVWLEPAVLEGHYIDILFCSYYHPKIKNYYNEYLYGELIDFIKNNYNQISSNSSFTVLKRND